MYKLSKKTISSIKRWFRLCYLTDPFEFDEVNNPPKKHKLFTKPKHPENLGIDVYHDLKIKQPYADGVVENGLTITLVDHNESPLQKTLGNCDLSGTTFIFEHLEPYKKRLTNELTFWFNTITQYYNEFLLFFETCENDGNRFNYYNDLIHDFLYKFSGTVDMGRYVGTYEIEPYKLIDDFLSSFVLMMDRITFVKNFLIKVEEKNKKSYIMNNSGQECTALNTGENFKMKSVNGKNKTERMINKPLKYMGLTVTDSSSNKHLYAEVESGDFNKYAYFMVYENPIPFNQSLANGRIINKYCFHIDNFDDGKGHDAIFVPSGMCLEIVNNDVTDKVGYLVAFEKNQGNNPIIAQLDKLDAGCDSIKVLTAENIKGLKYHY